MFGHGRAGRVALDRRDILGDMADREHAVTLARQAESHRPAEAAQAAGDDRNPPFHEPFLSPRQLCRI
jgi:hypothetical protein